MNILLDTNFIVTCVKEKIDFNSQINDIIDEKINWIIPEDILNEIKDLSQRKGLKILDKRSAEVALDLIGIIDKKKIKLVGNNPNIDVKIAEYLRRNKDVVLATLDKGLKKRVKNKILTIRSRKKLEII